MEIWTLVEGNRPRFVKCVGKEVKEWPLEITLKQIIWRECLFPATIVENYSGGELVEKGTHVFLIQLSTRPRSWLRKSICAFSIFNWKLTIQRKFSLKKWNHPFTAIDSIDVSFPPLYFFDSFYLFSFIFMCLSSDWWRERRAWAARVVHSKTRHQCKSWRRK